MHKQRRQKRPLDHLSHCIMDYMAGLLLKFEVKWKLFKSVSPFAKLQNQHANIN